MRKRERKRSNRGDPFERIARAADEAMAEVLEEDRLLREFGIVPSAGRSQ